MLSYIKALINDLKGEERDHLLRRRTRMGK